MATIQIKAERSLINAAFEGYKLAGTPPRTTLFRLPLRTQSQSRTTPTTPFKLLNARAKLNHLFSEPTLGNGVFYFASTGTLIYILFDDRPSFHSIFTVPLPRETYESFTLRVLSPSLLLLSDGAGKFYLVQWSPLEPAVVGSLLTTWDFSASPKAPRTLLDAIIVGTSSDNATAGGPNVENSSGNATAINVALLGYNFTEDSSHTGQLSAHPGLGIEPSVNQTNRPLISRFRDSFFVVSFSVLTVAGQESEIVKPMTSIRCDDNPVSGVIDLHGQGFVVLANGSISELELGGTRQTSSPSVNLYETPTSSSNREPESSVDRMAMPFDDDNDPDFPPLPPLHLARFSVRTNLSVTHVAEPLLSAFLSAGDPHWTPKQILLQAGDVDGGVWEIHSDRSGSLTVPHVASIPALAYLVAGRPDARFVTWHPWWEYAAVVGGSGGTLDSDGLGHVNVYAQPEAREQHAPQWFVDLNGAGVGEWDESKLPEEARKGGAIGSVWVGDAGLVVLGETSGAIIAVERGGRGDAAEGLSQTGSALHDLDAIIGNSGDF
ncbi:hypothetical protein M427DRAFT_151630 [Gonapodya prolifera JEL478]|uniref:Uncharacterized protein n=1 Tax=Gonapodya prolifera (strain JEL478) TaxID=1344416 RepID=A0A139AW03_GONPJ|nr:hypothetical protein M427DRAFT_151630 [Gonapodya prolifera JEL478]|eukprot:KXS20908.1 hypothetical protein M427DRAFT_151630 [Gonapodya prolifera JEL478]